MVSKCKFWLPKKKRFCANLPLGTSLFCGNHTPRSNDQWIPCPVDPSHSVLQENLEGHLRKCPLLKHAQSLSLQPFYQKGINGGKEEVVEEEDKLSLSSLATITSEMKRKTVYAMSVPQLSNLITKIKSIHASICNDIQDSHKFPDTCGVWINHKVDRKLPFKEKHVLQQASILGNLEDFGVLKSSGADTVNDQLDTNRSSVDNDDTPAVVEFGAGRGYLTQVLADCYGINKVFLVERKSYKLKADRSLRQKESVVLERLRIDIEDLNLNAVESLKGYPYLAIGKHLCGPATDMSLRCCLGEQCSQGNVVGSSAICYLRGLALATCCHHLCQWKHYINKGHMTNLGISKEDFHAITWFTSWAVDADHGSGLAGVVDSTSPIEMTGSEECGTDSNLCGVEEILKNLRAEERAVLGFMCKDIIDMGRLMWLKEHDGLESQLVKYVPSDVSPENHLLIARPKNKL